MTVWVDLPIPVGASLAYRSSTLPNGWLWENGAAISRTTYAGLFAVIGTTYGVGDGSTTFNLPDSRGRVPLGQAASGIGSTLAETGGSLDHTHTVPDTSSSGAHDHGGATGTPSASAAAALAGVVSLPTTTHTHTISSDGSHTHTIAATGSSNMAYLVAPTIIKY